MTLPADTIFLLFNTKDDGFLTCVTTAPMNVMLTNGTSKLKGTARLFDNEIFTYKTTYKHYEYFFVAKYDNLNLYVPVKVSNNGEATLYTEREET